MLRHGVIQRGDCKTIVRGAWAPAETIEPPALRTADGEKLVDIAKGTAPKRPRVSDYASKGVRKGEE